MTKWYLSFGLCAALACAGGDKPGESTYVTLNDLTEKRASEVISNAKTRLPAQALERFLADPAHTKAAMSACIKKRMFEDVSLKGDALQALGVEDFFSDEAQASMSSRKLQTYIEKVFADVNKYKYDGVDSETKSRYDSITRKDFSISCINLDLGDQMTLMGVDEAIDEMVKREQGFWGRVKGWFER